jgi:hypothetical protein
MHTKLRSTPILSVSNILLTSPVANNLPLAPSMTPSPRKPYPSPRKSPLSPLKSSFTPRKPSRPYVNITPLTLPLASAYVQQSGTDRSKEVGDETQLVDIDEPWPYSFQVCTGIPSMAYSLEPKNSPPGRPRCLGQITRRQLASGQSTRSNH